MVAERLTVIPIDSSLARNIQVGARLTVEVTNQSVFPHVRVAQEYRVMVVDRINELVECRLINEQLV